MNIPTILITLFVLLFMPFWLGFYIRVAQALFMWGRAWAEAGLRTLQC